MSRKRRFAIATLLLVLASCTASRGATVVSEHYRVRAAGFDAEEAAALLEQLHDELARHFGRAPESRLEVEIFADTAAFRRAMAAAGESDIGEGGFYSTRTRKAVLHVQPSLYYTRQLLLHEAAHQFHLLAATENQVPAAPWYVEGLAEYFGMHRWDGSRLVVGVVPAVSLEDYPAAALSWFEQRDWDLDAVVGSSDTRCRPACWALVHFLMHCRPERFRHLAQVLDQGGDSVSAWNDVFGPDLPALSHEFRAWLVSHQQPWSSIWNEWQQWGDALEGRSRATALAIRKETPRRFTVTVETLEEDATAGLIFDYRGPDDFGMLQVSPSGRIWIGRWNDGWHAWRDTTRDLALNGLTLAADLGEDDVTLSTDGRVLGSFPSTGKVGLHVGSGAARFYTRARTDP